MVIKPHWRSAHRIIRSRPSNLSDPRLSQGSGIADFCGRYIFSCGHATDLLEVHTIYKACVSGLCQGISPPILGYRSIPIALGPRKCRCKPQEKIWVWKNWFPTFVIFYLDYAARLSRLHGTSIWGDTKPAMEKWPHYRWFSRYNPRLVRGFFITRFDCQMLVDRWIHGKNR